MKKTLICLAALAYSTTFQAQVDSVQLAQESLNHFVDSIQSTLKYETGKIDINNGIATLNVPQGYKFLNASQSMYVLTTLWGNPPSDATLGLLFPENTNPLDSNFTYAVEITYSEEGYIEDDEAKDLNYDDLLKEMQADVDAGTAERVKQGYAPVKLLGWAQPPFYDEANKKLHWAKELQFGDNESHTLNYDIRILGRKGYLNLNAIGTMDVLPMVKSNVDKILASVEFNEGNRYQDFDASIDKVAAYGIGGLIAGKVLAKVGFFAILLKFWKLIAVGAVAAFAGIKKFFFGKKNDSPNSQAQS